MKNSILNLGKALSKAEQQKINGGNSTFSAECGVDECDCLKIINKDGDMEAYPCDDL